jgi:bisphosphoglycerate-dependent phosphoglycerate mutase family 1
MAVLVLLRHGESEWNAADVFTGWMDVGLSDRGRRQAERAGALLADRRLYPDVVHTSVQRRAIVTADLALEACGRSWVPVRRSWRLNSNHYGALQGRGKAEVRPRRGRSSSWPGAVGSACARRAASRTATGATPRCHRKPGRAESRCMT